MEYLNDPVKTAQNTAAELKFELEYGEETLPGAAQHYLDFAAWARFFEYDKPNSVVELGTGTGAFSEFLQIEFDNFATFDNKLPEKHIPFFFRSDIFEEEELVATVMMRMPKPLLLYCDNGDKPREVRTFSKYLAPGDYLATHDFHIEIQREDIPEDFTQLINIGLTAFFKKV